MVFKGRDNNSNWLAMSAKMTMKPYIALTIADLKAERAKLDGIIQTLEIYGDATAEEMAPDNGEVHAKAVKRSLIAHDLVNRPKRKYTRRQSPTNESPAVASVEQKLLERPETAGAAMKLFVRQMKGQSFKLSDLTEFMKREHSELLAARANGENAIYQNVFYWTSKGHLEKIGTGSLAAYRETSSNYFQES